jgi:hypothetical protein
LKEGDLVTFPFPWKQFFTSHLQNYVPAELAKVSMKDDSIISLEGISRVGVLSFR